MVNYNIFTILSVLLILKISQEANLRSFQTQEINNQPIIGVLTQHYPYPNPEYPNQNLSYFDAEQVKFLEMAGARVVPIFYDYDQFTLDYLFQRINGLFFPGGDATLFKNSTTEEGFSKLTKVGQYLINLAIESNKKGDYFPIWGTCLGFEIISMAIENYDKTLNKINDQNFAHNLKFQIDPKKLKVFKDASKEVIETLIERKFAFFDHHWGITLDHFKSLNILPKFFQISATSLTKNNVEFVSLIESHDYPIYGSQFHPELVPFNWVKDNKINHSKETIYASQYLANFFVSEARKNLHSFEDKAIEQSLLIYNYNPKLMNDFWQQIYFFKELGDSSNGEKSKEK